MGVFYHEEEPPPDPTKRCGCLTKALKVKEAFSNCHNLSRQVSCRTHEDDEEEEGNPLDDPNEEQEAIVSKIRSRALEKLRHKSNLSADEFSFVFSSPGIGELHFFTTHGPHIQEAKDDNQGAEKEEFASMRSFFTCCSSMVASREAFFSAKSNLPLSTSLNDLDTQDLQRLIFWELCHCEGCGPSVSTGSSCFFLRCPSPQRSHGPGKSASECQDQNTTFRPFSPTAPGFN